MAQLAAVLFLTMASAVSGYVLVGAGGAFFAMAVSFNFLVWLFEVLPDNAQLERVTSRRRAVPFDPKVTLWTSVCKSDPRNPTGYRLRLRLNVFAGPTLLILLGVMLPFVLEGGYAAQDVASENTLPLLRAYQGYYGAIMALGIAGLAYTTSVYYRRLDNLILRSRNKLVQLLALHRVLSDALERLEGDFDFSDCTGKSQAAMRGRREFTRIATERVVRRTYWDVIASYSGIFDLEKGDALKATSPPFIEQEVDLLVDAAGRWADEYGRLSETMRKHLEACALTDSYSLVQPGAGLKAPAMALTLKFRVGKEAGEAMKIIEALDTLAG